MLVAILGVIGPARAATVGPQPYSNGWTEFNLIGELLGPLGDDDPWSASLTVSGAGTCSVDKYGSCLLDAALTPGQTYDAVLSDSGGGFWYCSIYSYDVCHWDDYYDDTREYVFTYTGAPSQAINRYYAPVHMTVSKKKIKKQYKWRITCSAYRAGVAFAHAPLKLQYRDSKHPSWHGLGTMTTNAHGQAKMVVTWPPPRGTIRCTTAGDWHTHAANSRAMPVPVRR